MKPAVESNPAPFVEHTGDGSVANTDALLMSIASWRPTHSFFSNDTTDANAPPSSGLLSSSIMNVLQSAQAIPGSDDKT
jgi:hypothetical protein